MNKASEYGGEEDRASYKALWLSVVWRALSDACGVQEKHSAHPMAPSVGEARAWLLHDDKDFFLVCDLAGIDPRKLRQAARRAAQARWRRSALFVEEVDIGQAAPALAA